VNLAPCPPAAPQNVQCSDPQLGGRLDLSWDAVAEPEVSGYVVLYGTQSGIYPLTKEVGSQALIRLGGLTDGVNYFMVVQAKNSFGLQSAPSAQVQCSSSHGLGWAPPMMVSPIFLSKDAGGTPLLQWNLPALNIWGTPVSSQQCSVYRSSNPNFSPNRSSVSADRIAWVQASSCPGGACTYADSASPAIAFYYVTCQSPAGEESSVEFSPPAHPPYSAFYLEMPTQYTVEWSAVQARMDGNQLVPSYYEIYRGTNPDFQPDAANKSNRVGATTATIFGDIIAPGQTYYYKVMAVDGKGNVGPF